MCGSAYNLVSVAGAGRRKVGFNHTICFGVLPIKNPPTIRVSAISVIGSDSRK